MKWIGFAAFTFLAWSSCVATAIIEDAVVSSATTTTTKKIQPVRISYDDLLNNQKQEELLNALTETGLVSITNVPFETKDGNNVNVKEQTFQWLHGCVLESAASTQHIFGDGTRRRTLATHCVPGPNGSGIQKIKHHKESSAACQRFDASSQSFREGVSAVTELFAKKVSSVLDYSEPLLKTNGNQNEVYSFSTLADVVENGEHLEHFHSYQKKETASTEETIELHVDQGLFLVFTPGRRTSISSSTLESQLKDGFYIQLKDGSRAMLDFDTSDDLVFLLGDGVNQYVNDKIQQSLRAVPHALVMQPTEDNNNNDEQASAAARVWYGRMVLPPARAVHPQHGQTFDDLRTELIAASTTSAGDSNNKADLETHLSLGCSHNMMARQLEETACEANTLMCWHRCMNVTEYAGISEDTCVSQNKEVMCINPRGQRWLGENHGDYFPACNDPTTDIPLETPFPNMSHYPRNETRCSTNDFYLYAESIGYDHNANLSEMGAVFMWSVVTDTTTGEPTSVKGRLVVNELFGWISMGFAGHYPDMLQMFGAPVLMAMPGGNFSAATGLDLSLGTTINEYMIGNETTFRLWGTPVTSSSTEERALTTSVTQASADEFQDCFTSLSFQANGLVGRPFNLTGTDDLMWASNGNNYFMQYHGPMRGVFTMDWAAGTVTLKKEEDEEATTTTTTTTDGEDHSDHDQNGTSSSAAATTAMMKTAGWAALLATIAL